MVRQRLFRLLGGRASQAVTPAAGASGGDSWATEGDGWPSGDDVRSPGGGVRLPDDDVSSTSERSPRRPGRPENEDPAADVAAPARLTGPGAFDPGRRGVRAIAVVALVVVLGAAGWAWTSRPRTEPVSSSVGPSPGSSALSTPSGSGPVAGGAGPDAGGAGPVAAGAEVVVAVAGKVRRPGLVRLPAGARVADALESAGGPLPGVDVSLLNLARRVTDGELLLVGVTPPPGAAPAGAGSAEAPAGAVGGKVNLNTATVAQLDALPGVGPVLAQRIVTHREQHGGFRSVGDLRQVNGIGDARYEDLKDLVTV